jgi:hypothetical protein
VTLSARHCPSTPLQLAGVTLQLAAAKSLLHCSNLARSTVFGLHPLKAFVHVCLDMVGSFPQRTQAFVKASII